LVPVADRKTFNRKEVRKGEAIVIRKAERRYSVSAFSSALASFSVSVTERRMQSTIAVPASRKNNFVGNLLVPALI
jgi:hypothetical protein